MIRCTPATARLRFVLILRLPAAGRWGVVWEDREPLPLPSAKTHSTHPGLHYLQSPKGTQPWKKGSVPGPFSAALFMPSAGLGRENTVEQTDGSGLTSQASECPGPGARLQHRACGTGLRPHRPAQCLIPGPRGGAADLQHWRSRPSVHPSGQDKSSKPGPVRGTRPALLSRVADNSGLRPRVLDTQRSCNQLICQQSQCVSCCHLQSPPPTVGL